MRSPPDHYRDVQLLVGRGAWVKLVVLLAVAGWTAALVLDRFNAVTEQTGAADWAWAVSFLAPAVIGAALARRVPGNPVGWLLAIGPTLVGVSIGLFEYVESGVVRAVSTTIVVGPPGGEVTLNAPKPAARVCAVCAALQSIE